MENYIISSFTSTGRSGINLDEFGYKIYKNDAVCWVMDGVSPIICNRKQVWKFKNFCYAGKLLNNMLLEQEWKDLRVTLKRTASVISKGEHSSLFTHGAFFARPLFSLGIVKIQTSENKSINLEIGLYGDCVIIIDNDINLLTYEYSELEKLKHKLNTLFRVIDKILPNDTASCLKKIGLSIVRAQQIWLGKYRLYSVKKEFGPAIWKECQIENIRRIYIMSDGVSWYFKNNDGRLKELISIINEHGPERALEEVRNHENENMGFGRYDDATLMVIEIKGWE